MNTGNASIRFAEALAITIALMVVAALPLAALGKVEGSGIPGSPEMLRLGAQWKIMNTSAAKQRGRDRFSVNKYGMFIHWGISSTLGGIWKGEKMEEGGVGPVVSEWIMRRKSIPRAEYTALAKQFNPVNFDADEWVAIAKAAGMKYIVITSKQYGGFSVRLINTRDITFESDGNKLEPTKDFLEAGTSLNIEYSRSSGLPGVKITCEADGRPINKWILRNSNSMQNCVWPGREHVALVKGEVTSLRASITLSQ